MFCDLLIRLKTRLGGVASIFYRLFNHLRDWHFFSWLRIVKNRAVNIALVGVAVILFVMGYQDLHSAASNISRLITGAPTDGAVWLLIGGALAAITAIFGFSADHSDGNHSRQ